MHWRETAERTSYGRPGTRVGGRPLARTLPLPAHPWERTAPGPTGRRDAPQVCEESRARDRAPSAGVGVVGEVGGPVGGAGAYGEVPPPVLTRPPVVWEPVVGRDHVGGRRAIRRGLSLLVRPTPNARRYVTLRGFVPFARPIPDTVPTGPRTVYCRSSGLDDEEGEDGVWVDKTVGDVGLEAPFLL